MEQDNQTQSDSKAGEAQPATPLDVNETIATQRTADGEDETEQVEETQPEPEIELEEPDDEPVAPAPEAIPTPAIAPQLDKKIQEILAGLETLQADFESKIKYDDSKEEIISRLHRELQDYKADLLLKMIKPVLTELIRLYDDMAKTLSDFRAKPVEEIEVDAMVDIFESFQLQVEDILYNQEVKLFSVEEDTFDRKRQQAIKRVPTEAQAEHLTVAERRKKGFIYRQDKILRPEVVYVYAYTPPLQNSAHKDLAEKE